VAMRRTRDRGAMGEKRLDEHDSRGRKHSLHNEWIVAVGQGKGASHPKYSVNKNLRIRSLFLFG
jgi:hypothetical protein